MRPISRDRAIAECWDGIRKSECYRRKSPEFRNKIYELAEFSASKQVPVCGTILPRTAYQGLPTTRGKESGGFHDVVCGKRFASLVRGSSTARAGAKGRILRASRGRARRCRSNRAQ